MFFKLEKEKLENRRRARRALMVPEEGLEPSRTCVRQILSLLRLPLRHSGKTLHGAGEGNRTLVASLEGWNSAIELRPHGETRESISEVFSFVNRPLGTNLWYNFQPWLKHLDWR